MIILMEIHKIAKVDKKYWLKSVDTIFSETTNQNCWLVGELAVSSLVQTVTRDVQNGNTVAISDA